MPGSVLAIKPPASLSVHGRVTENDATSLASMWLTAKLVADAGADLRWTASINVNFVLLF